MQFAGTLRSGVQVAACRIRLSSVTETRTAKNTLDVFAAALDGRWSYRHANDADFDSALAALRSWIDAPISSDELGIELQRILALGIDGHSNVAGYSFLPAPVCRFSSSRPGRCVALSSDRKAFLADGFPF
jgi:hypothetical protein